MFSLFLAALAGITPGPSEAAAVRPDGPARNCIVGLARTATVSQVEFRRLGELPPGLLQLAVDKRVAGCSVTVLPTRDETGQHMMLLSPKPRPYLTPTERRSKPQRRLERHR